MIRASISIPNIDGGAVLDTYDKYGLVYLSSDTLLSSPTKGFEKTAYPEEEGEHVYAKTVDDAFDYKITFLVEAAGDIQNVNEKVVAFNNDLFEMEPGSSVKTFKEITFYNLYKKVKIVGIPTPMTAPSIFWRDANHVQADAAVVDLVIRVARPSDCDFYYNE